MGRKKKHKLPPPANRPKIFLSFQKLFDPKYIFILLFLFLCTPVFLKAISYIPVFSSYFERVGEYGSYFYHPKNNGTFFSQVDSIGYYSYLPSFLLHRDFDFSDDYAHYGLGPGPFGISSITSKEGNYWSVGPAVLWSPFFMIGHIIANISNKFNPSISVDGYNLIYELLCYMGTIFYVVFGLYLTFLGLKESFGSETSLFSTLAVLFASPLIFYAVFEPSMSHGPSFFALTLLFYGYSKILNNLDDRRSSLILAVGIALSSIVRWQNIVILPLAYIILFKNHPKSISNSLKLLKSLSLSIFLTILFFIPQAMAWKYVYGSFLTMPQGSGFLRPFQPEIINLFFSNIHGLFLWNPIYLFCFFGLIPLRKRIKSGLFMLFILFLFSQIYINSIASDWGCGEAFGMRRMVDLSYIYFFGFAAFIDFAIKKSKYKRLCWALFILVVLFLIYFNLVFIYQWKFKLIDRIGYDLNFHNYIIEKITLLPRIIDHLYLAFF